MDDQRRGLHKHAQLTFPGLTFRGQAARSKNSRRQAPVTIELLAAR